MILSSIIKWNRSRLIIDYFLSPSIVHWQWLGNFRSIILHRLLFCDASCLYFPMWNIKWKDSACNFLTVALNHPSALIIASSSNPHTSPLNVLSGPGCCLWSRWATLLQFSGWALYSGLHPLLYRGLEIIHWFLWFEFLWGEFEEAMWATCESACCLLMSLSDVLRWTAATLGAGASFW